MARTTGIDPRGPRFGAAITGVLLLVVVFLSFAAEWSVTNSATGVTTLEIALQSPLERLLTPAAIFFAVITAIFAWGAFAGVQRHPYGLFFKKVIRPRLAPPAELEDPAPPTFAQGVGLVITAIGLVLHIAGVPYALVIAASLAFIAAFLNSVFGYCLGCQIYLLLVRAGILSRKGGVTA